MDPSTKDVDLFRRLAERDVVFVSLDLNQLATANERYELKRCGCTAIYFAPFFGKRGFWDQATWIVQRWPMIEGFVGGAERGTVAEIQQNGRARVRTL